MKDALKGALTGLKVVDLTQMLAGPFAAQLLADHGADVIKIEAPKGDMTRTYGPYSPDDGERNMGGYFQSVNRNKRSVVIDLKSEAGKAVLLKLIDGADVLLENFRAGVLDRLGFSWEKLSQRNPRLVYACIRGFGDPRSGASPYGDWPAFDVVSQAMGGMMGVTGEPDGSPMKVGPGIGDLIPSALCAFGVVSAVLHARATGQGQFVDVGMVDSVLAFSERIVYQYSLEGVSPKAEGPHHPMVSPFGVFKASDGWVTVGCPTNEFWKIFCDLIQRPELVDDERFKTNDLRVRYREDVKRLITDFTSVRSKAQLKDLFGGHIPFGPVYSAADIFKDPHFAGRNMLVDLEQPGSSHKLTVAGVPVKMSLTPGGVHSRAPLLGEHTHAVLTEAGLSASEIDALKQSGAVYVASASDDSAGS